MRAAAIGGIALVAGCTSPGASASRTAEPVAPEPPSPSASVNAPPVPAIACVLDRGLTGTIGGLPVVVRLARRGDVLTGTYLYAKVGAPLALTGTVAGDVVKLSESAAGNTTGAFDGKCAAGGGAAGTWSSADGKRSLPFALALPAGVVVATERLKLRVRSKDAASPGDCTFERATPIVIGLPSAAAEATAAAAVAQAMKPIADPMYERAARRCSTNTDEGKQEFFDGNFGVMSQSKDVLALSLSASLNWVPSAHPTNAAHATVLNLDLATGARVDAKDVVTDAKRLYALAEGCSEGAMLPLADSAPALVFLPEGVRVVGTSYPHVAAYATFQGPVLGYGALLRDGLLKPAAPIARVWAGVPRAAGGASPCAKRWKLE